MAPYPELVTEYNKPPVGLGRHAMLRRIKRATARLVWVPTRTESVVGIKVGTFQIDPVDYEFYTSMLPTITRTRHHTSSCDRVHTDVTSITVYTTR
jgi:hypothetical protein